MWSDDREPLPPTSPGTVAWGEFELGGLIARGGMAEVYRARRRGSPEVLAIKCMRPHLAQDNRFVEMFIREGRLAVMLRHDAIVRTLEIGRVEGRYFIAMEYVGGKDLSQLLRRCRDTHQRIPVPHAIYMGLQVARGLHHAHTLADEEGRPLTIVNRDVSPSNIRVSYDGAVKLLDFGIAQGLLKFTSELGVLKGKFAYMSPEQIRGLPVDARSDIFSAGIVIHEILTREKLFRADTEFALMEKVRNAEVHPPSRFNRRVPPALDDVVMKALRRDPEDRFQTAAELAAELSGLLDHYRFQVSELRDLMRALFRRDHQAEEVELHQLRNCASAGSLAADAPGSPPSEGGTAPSRDESSPPVDSTPSATTPGLWHRFRSKLP